MEPAGHSVGEVALGVSLIRSSSRRTTVLAAPVVWTALWSRGQEVVDEGGVRTGEPEDEPSSDDGSGISRISSSTSMIQLTIDLTSSTFIP